MTLEQIANKVVQLQQELVRQSFFVSFDPAEVMRRSRLSAELAAWTYNYRDAYIYVLAANGWQANYNAAGRDLNLTLQRVGPKPIRPKSWVVQETEYGHYIEQTGPPVIDEV